MPHWRNRAVPSQCEENRKSRGRFGSAGLVLMILSCMAGAIGAEAARAGDYVMRNCAVPGQPVSPLHPWRMPEENHPYFDFADGCATGAGLTFSLNGSRDVDAVTFVGTGISKPTGPRSAIKLVKAALWYTARLAGTGQQLNFYTTDYRSDGSFISGFSTTQPGFENVVGEQQLSADTTGYSVGLRCGEISEGPNCAVADGTPLVIRGMEVTLSEDVPPFVLEPGGSLLEGGPRSGRQTLTYSASDPQSGLLKVDVLLDGIVVKSQDLASRCAYSDFTVCPASDDATMSIDTRSVPNGSYDLALRVQDAAGNERLLNADRRVEIDNVPKHTATSVSAYTVYANFKGSSRQTLTVPYGRRVSLHGRLTQGSQPVAAGITLEVLERLDRRRAREKSTRKVMTKSDGSFSIGLATSRPSRVVRFAYRPVGGGQVVSRALKLRVGAASRVRASLHGRVVRFNGRVLSGPIPKGGKRVQMEGRSPGSAWTRFKSLRTNSKGRFAGTYRLRVRRPGVVLKVRAVVPSESGYGYLSARSRAVKLRVR